MNKPTVTDVRRALHAAYAEAHTDPDIMWKGGDGAINVHYPSYIDGFNAMPLAEFELPDYLEIWSYVLGPGRHYTIYRAAVLDKTDPRGWHGPDVFALALEMIAEWVAEMRSERAGD